jgi:hypothetical protein
MGIMSGKGFCQEAPVAATASAIERVVGANHRFNVEDLYWFFRTFRGRHDHLRPRSRF